MVLYNVAVPGGDLLWHQRRILGEVAPTVGIDHSHNYAVLTPDGDVYLEDYSGRDRWITAVRFSATRRVAPCLAEYPELALTASLKTRLPPTLPQPKQQRGKQLKIGGRRTEDLSRRPLIYYPWERLHNQTTRRPPNYQGVRLTAHKLVIHWTHVA